MKFLFWLLIAIGLCAVADPIAYLAAKRSYEKNPDADRSAQYDILEMMFGRKKMGGAFVVCDRRGLLCGKHMGNDSFQIV